MDQTRNVTALIGRVLLASLFLISGYGKITSFAGTAGYMASAGLPFAELLLVLTIVIELGGGLAVLVGWKARWAALVLFLFIIPVTLVFHAFWSAAADQAMMQQIHFLKNVAIMGGLLLLCALGPGRISFDGDSA